MAQLLSGGGAPANGMMDPGMGGQGKPKQPKWGLGEGSSTLAPSEKNDAIYSLLNMAPSSSNKVSDDKTSGLLETTSLYLSEIVKLLGDWRNPQKVMKTLDLFEKIVTYKEQGASRPTDPQYSLKTLESGISAVFEQLRSLLRKSTHAATQKRFKELERRFILAGGKVKEESPWKMGSSGAFGDDSRSPFAPKRSANAPSTPSWLDKQTTTAGW